MIQNNLQWVMIYLVWGRSDILQSYFTSKALVLAKHLFSAIFESVDEDHFLKNRSHTDLRLQRYSEVAENNLGLMKNVSITKYKICLPPCNFYEPEAVSSSLSISLQPQVWVASISVNYVHQQIQKWQKIGVWPTPMPFM